MKIIICFSYALIFFISMTAFPQSINDSVKIPIQFRRGIEMPLGYQSYEKKYQGKNLLEEKRKLYPLDKITTGTGIWTELNPKVPRVDYIGIHFVNKDTGWACGDLGAIIKTTDGGQNWTVSETNTTSLILKIFSLDGQLVIASGYDGLILRSTDSGEAFEQITSGVGTGIDLWGVQMVNDTLGWICGMYQTLLKTTDAGLSWNQVNTGLNQHYWSLDFLNENFGMVVCGNGVVLKTVDGGNSWAQIQTGDARALYSIDIIDSLHIAAVGQWGNDIQYGGGKNIYSSDAGLTWVLNPDIPTYTDANWIDFVDADTSYTMMVDHGIYKTTNRGQSWFGVGGGGDWQLDLVNDGTGYSGGDGLNIYKRTNGLENWSKLFLNINWNDVFFVNEIKGFLIGDVLEDGLYITEDGGLNFQKIENSPGGNVLTFLNDNVGFIGGRSYTRIYKTVDAGNTWNLVNISGLTDTVGRINKIFFIDSTTGWAVANGILRTTDYGLDWFAQLNAPFAGLTSIYFVDSLYGWATDGNHRPYKTTDGGLNWIEQTNLNIWDSEDIFFRDYQNGCLIGFNELYNTIDSGFTWIPNSSVTGFGIGKFSTFQDSTIFIVGSKTFRSLDGGENWFEFAELNGITLTGLSLLNSGFGFGVGSGGLVLKYYDTTYIPVELISFEGDLRNNEIILTWITASELNNYGFEIQKYSDNKNWQEIGFVRGKGTSTEINHYSFSDIITKSEEVCYRLKQIDYDGSFTYSKVITVSVENLPLYFSLSQNYPNPFNPETNISFTIPEETNISIRLYNITGREIRVLVNEKKRPGYYTIKLKGGGLSSGVYFCRLVTTSGFTAVKKLILLK